jgi:transcriptional regulator with XRE-family HTH domain
MERGLKQYVAAERAGLSRRWLVDVENGHLQPKFADLLRLVDVLGADITEAPGVRSSRAGPKPRRLSGEEGNEAERREFLGWLSAFVGSAAGIDVERLASPVADVAWLRDAEIVSIGLAGQREAVEAAALLPPVLGHLASLESMLPASAELTARTALLAGDLLLGYRRHIGERTRQRLGDAYRCFVLAESLGSPAVVARTMNRWAALHDQRGDLPRALAFQDEAVLGVERTARTSLPWMLARRAEMRADSGDDRAAMRDIERAESVLAGPEEWWSMGPRGTVELAAYRGAVLSSLGRQQEAADTLTWVLERMDPSKVMWRATVAADRDAVLAQL